jgi:hypothetical protein
MREQIADSPGSDIASPLIQDQAFRAADRFSRSTAAPFLVDLLSLSMEQWLQTSPR